MAVCKYCGHEYDNDVFDASEFCGNDCEIAYWKERAETAEAKLESFCDNCISGEKRTL